MPEYTLDQAREVLRSQPFSAMLGARLTRYEDAGVTLELAVTHDHLQQHGYVHGGVISYLADNALTFAGGVELGPAVLTAGMNITYLRPAEGGTLIARANTLTRTSRTAVTEVLVSVEDGEKTYVCAAATATVSRMR